jgi:general secretion pathway protein F
MKAYEYRGFDRAGHVCKGLVDAMSVKDAREKLARNGILADRVSVTGRQLRFPSDRRSMVYRELSALLGAGMPLVRALDILIQSPEMGESAVLLAGVRDSVREGASLADAFSRASESVTPFEKAIVEAAEKSATVEPMLERLAVFLEDQSKLRDRIQSALIYPAIILTVGICVAILMLGLLVPRAREILAGSNIPLPALTRYMIAFGAGLLKWGLPVLALLIAAAVAVRRKLRQDLEFRKRWNQHLFGIPVFGKGYTLLVSLRFARTLEIMIHGGVSLIDGLIFAGRATGSPWIASLAETEAESVRHGSSLSDAVRRIPPLAQSLPGWIQIGEASGGLERLLSSAGQRYQDHWDRFIARSLSFMEPILIFLIGAFVLLVTLSVLLPVLSLSQAIGK